MKFVKLTAVFSTIAVAATLIFDSTIFSRELFSIFQDRVYTDRGIETVENYDPDENILFLPSLKNKKFFQSINDLSVCRRKEVRKFMYIYLTRGRDYVKRSIQKSEFYLSIISEIFARHPEVPPELALLPLLESGFNPRAVSRSSAVGLWQFMRGTSEMLDLRTDHWIDERRDIEKSTEAAIRHLKTLYGIFNDWELALAAYNGGAGHVGRAMKRTGAKTFWDLMKSGALRTETSEYVPRFAALLIIYQNQELLQLKDELEMPALPRTDTVRLTSPANISNISKLSGTSLAMLKLLNPELNRDQTPPYYQNYTLRLPAESKQILDQHKSETSARNSAETASTENTLFTILR
ncbi:MAG TPA: lytic transglycosylase domain-containing protein [Spirochaetota bacterium]|nr:lytic transglycosylase domain-containing protein [Spirochaetota bacterium]